MPSRSLQRPPPRSLPWSPERTEPCQTRRLAGRACSRHGHPLLKMQDNKAEQTAATRVACQLPEDNRTEDQIGFLIPTLRRSGAARTLSGARSSRQLARSAGRARRGQSNRPGSYAPNGVAHGACPFPPGHSAEPARARPYKTAVSRGRARSGQTVCTCSACGPLGPCVRVYSTFWFSSRLR